MKRLELLHKGSKNNLLTVAKDRITIKFAADQTAEEDARIQAFFIKVAEQLVDEPLTMRGHLHNGHIRMTGGGCKRFYERDFT